MAVYKDTKNNTWRAVYRYTDWKGERKQTQKRGFETKREALAWEREQMNKVTSDLDMTFASFIDVYTADTKNRIKENTWHTKEHIMRTKILPYFSARCKIHTRCICKIRKDDINMNNKSSFEKNGGTYRMVNGYRIPNLDLPEEAKKPLGRWGQAHLEYLSHNKKVLLTTMLAKGSLWKYLQEIDKQSQEMFEALVEDMCIDNDITEDLKENDQMKWVQEMNRIYSFAAELVLEDLIYS